MNELMNLLKNAAPALATAVGGPLGGMAMNAIAAKLGVEATPSLDAIAFTAIPPIGPSTAVARPGATFFNRPDSMSFMMLYTLLQRPLR